MNKKFLLLYCGIFHLCLSSDTAFGLAFKPGTKSAADYEKAADPYRRSTGAIYFYDKNGVTQSRGSATLVQPDPSKPELVSIFTAVHVALQ